ncbi:MAG TPA: sigma-70 family RNA polymerase sigma factor, partial [Gemmataceae bacterium]|nr:sigma-70 family RNA polymerase sigma factor [Gemmataceae bacterium]
MRSIPLPVAPEIILMPTHADRILRCIRRIASQAGPEPGDSELLTRFLTIRDPAAFEALVARHGPMVLRVCQHVLGNRHDAEDAFQATFLVLARKAASVRPPGALAAWLHGVAYHVAQGARRGAARHHEGLAPDLAPPDPRPDPLAAMTAREALQILEEEVQRLPEPYRLPVVLCCLQELSQEEAARQLGWTPGSVKGRLERGRKRLHQRLAGRGLSLSAVLALVEVSRAPAAGLAQALAAATVKAAVAFSWRCPLGTVPVSEHVSALAGAGLKHAATTKVMLGLLLLLAAGAGTAGLVIWAGQPLGGEPPGLSSAAEPGQSARGAGQPKPPSEEDQARMDRRGDALPEGALQRFGSARLRHGGVVHASALSPDGKTLATAGDHSVMVWNLATGKVARRFPCDRGSTYCRPGLTFSPDGSRLGYVRGSLFACVWDLKTGSELQRFERRFEDGLDKFWGGHCQFANDGKQLTLLSHSAIETWDLGSGTQTTSVPMKAVALLSPDGKTYLRNEGAAGLSLGDARTGSEVSRLTVEVRHDGIEDGLAFSPDGQTLAIVHEQREIQLHAVASSKVLASFPLPDSARKKVTGGGNYWEYRVAFSTDGKTLLLGTAGGIIHRWEIADGKELQALNKQARVAVAGMHTLPEDRTLVSTSGDGVIRRWDLKTGREVIEAESYEGRSAAAYSPEGRFVAVGDARGRIDLWDGQNGKLIRTVQRKGAGVWHLAFSPSGERLAAAEQSGTVRFWQVPSGQPGDVWQRESEANVWCCNGIHFSPDGRFLCVS